MVAWRFLAGFGAALNMLDAVATCIEIEHGLATENNPVMAVLYGYGVPFFMLAKLSACVMFFFLATNSDQKLAKLGISLGLLTYVGIAGYHLAGAFL